MIVRLFWRGSRQPDGSRSVDAFWVEATQREAEAAIFPHLTPKAVAESKELAARLAHLAEQLHSCPYCFLVTRDLRSIAPREAHYPVHQFWGAYSPFEAMPRRRIRRLEDLASIEIPPVAGTPGTARKLWWNLWARLQDVRAARRWLAAERPGQLLELIAGRGSDRRARLLTAAFCRLVALTARDEPAGRAAVEVAERYANEGASWAERDAAREACLGRYRELCSAAGRNDASASAWALAGMAAAERPAEREALADVGRVVGLLDQAGVGDREAVGVIRCLFGNPFLPPVTFSPAALTHADSAAVKLATVIYKDRNPDTGALDAARLGILADALEEAGVEERAALDHLRGPGPHWRGCHVVDAVLEWG